MIGHRTSDASLAAGLVYLEKEIPAVTGTATADELTANPWYFRTTYSNRLQAELIAGYMTSVLGFEQATLITTNTAYSNSLSEAFVNATTRRQARTMRVQAVEAIRVCQGLERARPTAATYPLWIGSTHATASGFSTGSMSRLTTTAS